MIRRDNGQVRSSLHRRVRAGFDLVAGYAVSYLPLFSSRYMVRRLVGRANMARDARNFRVAANLYEEALDLAPGRIHLHIQCGHMFKESGDLAAAEHHYRAAERFLPDDPDLALQIGHFLKVAMRPDEAEQAYLRALKLRPGWRDAAEELARIQGTLELDALAGDANLSWVVPELLPQPIEHAPFVREHIRVLRLAPRRQRGPGGMAKTLEGIEAIRGYCVSIRSLTSIHMLLDDRLIARDGLHRHPITAEGAAKYVFNIWHDFSGVPAGRYPIELRMMDGAVTVRTFRDHVLIAPPSMPTPQLLASDAFVPASAGESTDDIIDAINTRPSMVRSARRTMLPADIRTILVQRADQLGDLVCSVPAIRRLRAHFPAAKLVGLLTAANVALGRRLDLFDEVIVAEFAEDGATGRRVMPIDAQARLRRQLVPFAFDLAIDLCENSDSRPLLLLSGAKFLFGFKPREWPWLSAGFEMAAVDPINRLEGAAPSRKILALVEALATLRPDPLQRPPLRTISSELAAAYGINAAIPFVILHSGARLPFSRWTGFAALAERLAGRGDIQVLFLQDDATAVQPLPSDRIKVFTGNLPFDDFDTLLASCAVFIGNDSGVKHLAALRGARVVSLHMARLNWSEWGQEGDGIILSRRVPCAGCGIHSHAEECGKDFACIRHIGIAEVYDAAVKMVAAVA